MIGLNKNSRGLINLALFWWQWIALIFTGFGLLFFLGVWFGFIVFAKTLRANPKFEGIFYDDDGKVKEKRAIKQAGTFSSEWQLRSQNPTKVRFKILARGIGKSEEIEWDTDDYLEQTYTDGDKKLIHFNLNGLSTRWSMEKRTLMRLLNAKSVENAENKGRGDKLESRMKEQIEYILKTAKATIPFTPKPQGAKK